MSGAEFIADAFLLLAIVVASKATVSSKFRVRNQGCAVFALAEVHAQI